MATRSMEVARMPEQFFVPCKIENGGFSSERTFSIRLADGKVLEGTAHVDYLRDSKKRPLREDNPEPGEAISGFVACRKLRELQSGSVLIEVPSEYVIDVQEAELVALP